VQLAADYDRSLGISTMNLKHQLHDIQPDRDIHASWTVSLEWPSNCGNMAPQCRERGRPPHQVRLSQGETCGQVGLQSFPRREYRPILGSVPKMVALSVRLGQNQQKKARKSAAFWQMAVN
jgi:hypothetical protein